MQQIEGKVGQALRTLGGQGISQGVEMRDTALIRYGDLAVKNHCPAVLRQPLKWLLEQRCPINAAPAQQLE